MISFEDGLRADDVNIFRSNHKGYVVVLKSGKHISLRWLFWLQMSVNFSGSAAFKLMFSLIKTLVSSNA